MSRENLIQNPELAPIVEKYEKYFAKLGIDKYQQLIDEYHSKLKAYQDSVKVGNKSVKNPKEPMGEQNYNRPFVSPSLHWGLCKVNPYRVLIFNNDFDFSC
jgi:hypothetical protein